MTNAGIHNDDLLIVDKAESATSGKIVIAVINGEMTVKRLMKQDQRVYLQPENPAYEPIEITAEQDFAIWGVVTTVIHKVL